MLYLISARPNPCVINAFVSISWSECIVVDVAAVVFYFLSLSLCVCLKFDRKKIFVCNLCPLGLLSFAFLCPVQLDIYLEIDYLLFRFALIMAFVVDWKLITKKKKKEKKKVSQFHKQNVYVFMK